MTIANIIEKYRVMRKIMQSYLWFVWLENSCWDYCIAAKSTSCHLHISSLAEYYLKEIYYGLAVDSKNCSYETKQWIQRTAHMIQSSGFKELLI